MENKIQLVVGKLWNTEYRQFINKLYSSSYSPYHFEYTHHPMSHFDWRRELNIIKESASVSKYNWSYISNHNSLTWDIITEYIDIPWDWEEISQNPNITWDIIKNNPSYPWIWEYIPVNPNITWDIIIANPDYPWDWHGISYHPGHWATFEFPEHFIKRYSQHITWDIIISNPDKPWNWYGVSANPNITWDIIHANPDKPWNWYGVSENPNITWDIIQANPEFPWKESYISHHPNITWDIIQANPDYDWCWLGISKNPNITWDIIESSLYRPWDLFCVAIDGKMPLDSLIEFEELFYIVRDLYKKQYDVYTVWFKRSLETNTSAKDLPSLSTIFTSVLKLIWNNIKDFPKSKLLTLYYKIKIVYKIVKSQEKWNYSKYINEEQDCFLLKHIAKYKLELTWEFFNKHSSNINWKPLEFIGNLFIGQAKLSMHKYTKLVNRRVNYLFKYNYKVSTVLNIIS